MSRDFRTCSRIDTFDSALASVQSFSYLGVYSKSFRVSGVGKVRYSFNPIKRWRVSRFSILSGKLRFNYAWIRSSWTMPLLFSVKGRRAGLRPEGPFLSALGSGRGGRRPFSTPPAKIAASPRDSDRLNRGGRRAETSGRSNHQDLRDRGAFRFSREVLLNEKFAKCIAQARIRRFGTLLRARLLFSHASKHGFGEMKIFFSERLCQISGRRVD